MKGVAGQENLDGDCNGLRIEGLSWWEWRL